MTITVYTKPDCGQCEQTKKQLERKGLPYKAIDVFEDPEAMKVVEESGIMLMPMVVIEHNGQKQHWHGFRYDRIRDLTKNS